MEKDDKVRWVKSQGQTRDHHCHWPGCSKSCPPAAWGCKQHWFMLPKHLRDEVWAAYRPGQEVNMTPSRAYLEVAHRVQDWIIRTHFAGGLKETSKEQAVMPPIQQKSSLLASLGDRFRKAAEVHRNDDVELPGGGNLPAGIETGVAQLVECKFAVYKSGANQGKHYWIARGVVVSPDEHVDDKKVKHYVKNMHTQIMEAFCDTPGKTRPMLEDHMGWIQNQMKMLGVGPESLGADAIEEACEALVREAPFFRFRTWKGAPTNLEEKGGKWFAVTKGQPDKGPYINKDAAQAANQYAGTEPLTNQQWGGRTEWHEVVNPAAKVVDSSKPVNGKPTTVAAPTPQPAAAKSPPPKGPGSKPVAKAAPEPEPEPGDDDTGDPVEMTLDELATAAESKDDAAQEQLKELALSLMSEEEFDAIGTWGELVLKIEEIQAAGDGAEEAAPEEEPEPEPEPEPEEEWEPKVEEVYGYKPADPKTKKPGKKLIEVEVTKVNGKNNTVDLANLDNKKVTHKGVKWDALEPAP